MSNESTPGSDHSQIQTMEELETDYKKQIARQAKYYKRTANALVLLTHPESETSSEYDILYTRMDSAEKVVDWMRHLMGKTWVTIIHLRIFVAVAIELGAKTVDA